VVAVSPSNDHTLPAASRCMTDVQPLLQHRPGMGRLTGIALIKGLSRSALALNTRDRLFASGLVVLRRVNRLLGLGSLVAVDEL
jgi:hypothetical protein